jgi:hypothetical protein
MLSLIIQISIISIIFIFLVHHLLCFFKTTLTVPKIKDLVNSPTTKYQHIFDTISHTNTNTNTNTNTTLDTDSGSEYSVIDLLPSDTNTDNSMKDELKNFLKKQLNNDDLSFTNNSTNNSSAYSPY